MPDIRYYRRQTNFSQKCSLDEVQNQASFRQELTRNTCRCMGVVVTVSGLIC